MFGFSKKINTNPELVRKVLNRGVEDVFIRENLEKKLLSGKPLRVKLGFDPTSPRIHIGRAIILRKLREFQNLGHTAVFIVGDFTARIGDPSDKLEKRPMLTEKDIKKNLETYKTQVGKIIDLRKAEFHFNSTWLSKLTFTAVAELAESFSLQQMSSRRNFKDRIDRGEEISLREFLYPLMQGYDSVAVKADVEIGGFDQLFNLKAGRTIQRRYGQPEQDVLTSAMLEGTDGRKMSSSWGNVINILDEPTELFGKVMSVRDELITKYFLLCTDVSETEIRGIGEKMESGALNPRDAKAHLAEEIVKIYHGEKAAGLARQSFTNVFSNAGFPTDAQQVFVAHGAELSDAVIASGAVASKSEYTRLVAEGAVFDFKTGQKVADRKACVSGTMELRIGKHRFLKITVRS